MTYIVTADRSRWGKNCYHATPVVNGQSYKPIDIWAFTKEDFSTWSAEQQENGAQPIFDYSTFDFGKVKSGTVVTAKFKFKNMGGRPFHIYKMDPENSRVTVPASVNDTAPGASGEFVCRLDTTGLSAGDNDVAVILTTNSPLRPVISLYISGTVTK